MERLIAETRDLIAKGVHNLNFVTPEHWWPHIQRLCEAIRKDYPDLPAFEDFDDLLAAIRGAY